MTSLRTPKTSNPNPPHWRGLAACRGMDTELFFPGRGESSPAAEVACRSCEVRVECGEQAIGGERFGIWGGMSERERRHVRALRREVESVGQELVA